MMEWQLKLTPFYLGYLCNGPFMYAAIELVSTIEGFSDENQWCCEEHANRSFHERKLTLYKVRHLYRIPLTDIAIEHDGFVECYIKVTSAVITMPSLHVLL